MSIGVPFVTMKMTNLLFIVLILTFVNMSFSSSVKLQTITKFKYIDYLWSTEMQRQKAIESGNYNASSCVIYDVDQSLDGRIFVTVVTEKGVPASLATISDKKGKGGRLLRPYPNWSWYNNGNKTNCKKIISVYRVSIKCNHMFVLDCGQIGDDKVCPPKLLVFDLGRNKLVHKRIIPPHIATNKNGTGLFVTPLAYVKDCHHIYNATVYMSDIKGNGLVTYNRHSGFYRIESDFMKPTHPNFTIQNISFYLEDGILGLAPVGQSLLYAPLAGHKVYKMNMYDLKQNSSNSQANRLTKLAGTLSGQTGPIASKGNVLFFSNVPEMSILCADATRKFDPSNTGVIVQDSRMQFVSGLKIVKDIRGDKLLFASNRIQLALNNMLNLNELNFRIFQIYIRQIHEQTNCFSHYP